MRAMQLNKRLLRLSLFQLGLGFSVVVFNGAFNRVLIAEEQIPAGVVGWLLSLGLFVAPIRALMGFMSDREKRTFGYRRFPYAWFGTVFIFLALSSAPFSLLLLSKASELNSHVPFPVGFGMSTFIFLLYAVGLHIGQTGYLAMVTDLTPQRERSRAMAYLWVTFIIGQIISAFIVSAWLEDYHPSKLVQVMQTGAVVFFVLAVAAIWGQEKPIELEDDIDDFSSKVWTLFEDRRMRWFFATLFIGTLGLTAQDVLLEPYGGQVLGMAVSETARLTAVWGIGMLTAMLIAWRVIPRLESPLPVTLVASLLGMAGFGLISSASLSKQVLPFVAGTFTVGVASGLFLISTLSWVVGLANVKTAGLYVGMWGLVQTTASGVGALGGSNLRDLVIRTTGNIAQSYTTVYVAEMALLAVTLLLFVFVPRELLAARTKGRSAFAGLTEIPGN